MPTIAQNSARTLEKTADLSQEGMASCSRADSYREFAPGPASFGPGVEALQQHVDRRAARQTERTAPVDPPASHNGVDAPVVVQPPQTREISANAAERISGAFGLRDPASVNEALVGEAEPAQPEPQGSEAVADGAPNDPTMGRSQGNAQVQSSQLERFNPDSYIKPSLLSASAQEVFGEFALGSNEPAIEWLATNNQQVDETKLEAAEKNLLLLVREAVRAQNMPDALLRRLKPYQVEVILRVNKELAAVERQDQRSLETLVPLGLAPRTFPLRGISLEQMQRVPELLGGIAPQELKAWADHGLLADWTPGYGELMLPMQRRALALSERPDLGQTQGERAYPERGVTERRSAHERFADVPPAYFDRRDKETLTRREVAELTLGGHVDSNHVRPEVMAQALRDNPRYQLVEAQHVSSTPGIAWENPDALLRKGNANWDNPKPRIISTNLNASTIFYNTGHMVAEHALDMQERDSLGGGFNLSYSVPPRAEPQLKPVRAGTWTESNLARLSPDQERELKDTGSVAIALKKLEEPKLVYNPRAGIQGYDQQLKTARALVTEWNGLIDSLASERPAALGETVNRLKELQKELEQEHLIEWTAAGYQCALGRGQGDSRHHPGKSVFIAYKGQVSFILELDENLEPITAERRGAIKLRDLESCNRDLARFAEISDLSGRDEVTLNDYPADLRDQVARLYNQRIAAVRWLQHENGEEVVRIQKPLLEGEFDAYYPTNFRQLRAN